MQFDSQIQSTVPNGVAPFVVASQTLVTNLNANFLNGYGPGAFAEANHDHTSSQITDSTAAGRTLLLSPSASQQRADLGLMNRATTISAVASVKLSREEEPVGTPRPGIRFLQGSGVTISVANDDEHDRYDVTISTSLSASVLTQHSLTGGGDLSTTRTLALVNDEASPSASKYYGTNGGGTRGWHTLPVAGGNVRSITKVIANYSATTSDSIIVLGESGSEYTVTLPTVGVQNGQQFTVVRPGSGGVPPLVNAHPITEDFGVPGEARTWVWYGPDNAYHLISSTALS